ncbi:MAG: hypothetical protein ACR2NN_03865 [Bryobacteraceae bacterium]
MGSLLEKVDLGNRYLPYNPRHVSIKTRPRFEAKKTKSEIAAAFRESFDIVRQTVEAFPASKLHAHFWVEARLIDNRDVLKSRLVDWDHLEKLLASICGFPASCAALSATGKNNCLRPAAVNGRPKHRGARQAANPDRLPHSLRKAALCHCVVKSRFHRTRHDSSFHL